MTNPFVNPLGVFRARTARTFGPLLASPVVTALLPSSSGEQRGNDRALRRDHQPHWRAFVAYVRQYHPDSVPLPAAGGVVACYLRYTRGQGKRAQDMESRVRAIAYMHLQAGYASPCEHDVVLQALTDAGGDLLQEIESALAVLPAPKTSEQLCARAVALLGLHQPIDIELIAQLDAPNVQILGDAAILAMKGREGILLPRLSSEHGYACVVRALWRWREVYPIHRGPLFPVHDKNGDVQPYTRLSPANVRRQIQFFRARVGLAPRVMLTS